MAGLKRISIICLLLLIFLVFVNCEKKTKKLEVELAEAYLRLFPKNNFIKGWKRVGEVKVYRGKQLCDAIDGAAEKYFQYNFDEAYFAIYSSKRVKSSVEVQIYKMGNSSDAFGIFSIYDDINFEHIMLPDTRWAATVSDVNLDFCRGEYFVRLRFPKEPSPNNRKILIDFANNINVPHLLEKPALFAVLPGGYQSGSLKYFHN